MIFADKLINERKKNGWSQEELAEKLNISRQAVSKWEGAQAIPGIQRVIAIAELFNVTTDYLLKDEYEPQNFTSTRDMPVNNEIKQIRKVTLQEANEFLEVEKDNAYKINRNPTRSDLENALNAIDFLIRDKEKNREFKEDITEKWQKLRKKQWLDHMW